MESETAEVHTTKDDDGSTTTVVEKSGSGGTAVIAVVLLIAVLIGGYDPLSTMGATNSKNDTIAGAAKSVGSAADKVRGGAEGSSGK